MGDKNEKQEEISVFVANVFGPTIPATGGRKQGCLEGQELSKTRVVSDFGGGGSCNY